jgi:hypothetical protein
MWASHHSKFDENQISVFLKQVMNTTGSLEVLAIRYDQVLDNYP